MKWVHITGAEGLAYPPYDDKHHRQVAFDNIHKIAEQITPWILKMHVGSNELACAVPIKSLSLCCMGSSGIYVAGILASCLDALLADRVNIEIGYASKPGENRHCGFYCSQDVLLVDDVISTGATMGYLFNRTQDKMEPATIHGVITSTYFPVPMHPCDDLLFLASSVQPLFNRLEQHNKNMIVTYL
jgi:hypothetical protein